MANGDVFNISKGQCVSQYLRVFNGDPSTSRLVVVGIAATGLESDTTLIRRATLADVITAGATREWTASGYSRHVYVAADLPAYSPDNVNDQALLDLPDPTWGPPVGTGGGDLAKLIVAYVPNIGTSTDAQIVPMTLHDFPWTPDGVKGVSAQITGFFKSIKGA